MNTFKPIGKAIGTILRFLTYLFITLRACDAINWAWYIVLSPVLISYLIWALCCMIATMAATEME